MIQAILNLFTYFMGFSITETILQHLFHLILVIALTTFQPWAGIMRRFFMFLINKAVDGLIGNVWKIIRFKGVPRALKMIMKLPYGNPQIISMPSILLLLFGAAVKIDRYYPSFFSDEADIWLRMIVSKSLTDMIFSIAIYYCPLMKIPVCSFIFGLVAGFFVGQFLDRFFLWIKKDRSQASSIVPSSRGSGHIQVN